MESLFKNLQENLATTIKDTIEKESKEMRKKISLILEEKIPKIEQEVSNVKLTTNINSDEIARIDKANEEIKADNEAAKEKVDDLVLKVEHQSKIIMNQNKRIAEIENIIDTMSEQRNDSTDVTIARKDDKIPNERQVLPAVQPVVRQPENDQNTRQLRMDLARARRCVGISPITKEDLLLFCSDTPVKDVKDDELFHGDSHGNTRKKAAEDYLENWLCFNHNDITIENTKMAKDPTTKIMWIQTTEANVNKIYRKAASVKNNKVRLHTFFPSQVWERKVKLNTLCMEEKGRDRNFKFIIKPGVSDLELLTKKKGEMTWLKTNLNALGELPPIKTKATFSETNTTPKMRITEAAKMKRKASVSPHNPKKKHQGYASPDHAFEDKEMPEDATASLEEEVKAAEAGDSF